MLASTTAWVFCSCDCDILSRRARTRQASLNTKLLPNSVRGHFQVLWVVRWFWSQCVGGSEQGKVPLLLSFPWAAWTQPKPQREWVWWYWLVLKVVASSWSSAAVVGKEEPDDFFGLWIFLRERCGDRREGREDIVYNGHRNPVLMCCLMVVNWYAVVKCICFYYLCLAPESIYSDCLLSRWSHWGCETVMDMSSFTLLIILTEKLTRSWLYLPYLRIINDWEWQGLSDAF